MSGMGKRFLDWSVGSIVGNIVWGAVAAIGLFYFNESTGCVYIVLDSMRGHELELAGWTIAFALFGALVGLMVRHRVAIGQLRAKDDEIAEDSSDDCGVQMLTGEDALNFIRSLTDNQKSILAEIYDSGGSISADPFDGDLSQLRKYGLVSMPPIVAPGMPCKWSIPPNVNRILRDNPDLLEVDSKEIEPTPKGISSLSSIMAHAVWRAYEHGDMPIGEAHEEVWASIIDGDGIFERVCHPYMGARNPTDKYRLTSKWRIALKDEATLDLVKIAARGY